MMYVEFGYVEGPPIEDDHFTRYGVMDGQQSYFIALHELGHFALGHTQGRPPKEKETFYFDNGVVKSEAQAWEWALDNSLESPDERTRRFMVRRCLDSYRTGARFSGGGLSRLTNGNRDWVAFRYDDPDTEYVLGVRERLLHGSVGVSAPSKALVLVCPA
jgi:hypothetical protein